MKSLIFIIIFIIIIFNLIYFKEHFINQKETIFVSIASYRDKECSKTLETLFNNASIPQNVFIGICEQNSDDLSEKCLQNSKYKDNVRIFKLDYRDAKGPAYARYFCSKLYNNETYFLQIDSHMYFEKNWDIHLIEMLKQTKNPKAVLTVYPPTKEQLKSDGLPQMDSVKISHPSSLPMFFASFVQKSLKEPEYNPKPYYAAGFMFTYGSFLKEVPYDKDLEYLFQGEEVLFSLRMFTHGYDTYTPNKKVCSHYYNRSGSDVHLVWNEIPDYSLKKKKAEQKVSDYLKGLRTDGLGSQRSLKEFIEKLEIKLN